MIEFKHKDNDLSFIQNCFGAIDQALTICGEENYKHLDKYAHMKKVEKIRLGVPHNIVSPEELQARLATILAVNPVAVGLSLYSQFDERLKLYLGGLDLLGLFQMNYPEYIKRLGLWELEDYRSKSNAICIGGINFAELSYSFSLRARILDEVTLPKYINGDLRLIYLQRMEKVIPPKFVNGDVYLTDLKETYEKLVLPEIINGDLCLSSLDPQTRVKFLN